MLLLSNSFRLRRASVHLKHAIPNSRVLTEYPSSAYTLQFMGLGPQYFYILFELYIHYNIILIICQLYFFAISELLSHLSFKIIIKIAASFLDCEAYGYLLIRLIVFRLIQIFFLGCQPAANMALRFINI